MSNADYALVFVVGVVVLGAMDAVAVAIGSGVVSVASGPEDPCQPLGHLLTIGGAAGLLAVSVRGPLSLYTRFVAHSDAATGTTAPSSSHVRTAYAVATVSSVLCSILMVSYATVLLVETGGMHCRAQNALLWNVSVLVGSLNLVGVFSICYEHRRGRGEGSDDAIVGADAE